MTAIGARVLARSAEIERIVARLAHQIVEPNDAEGGLVLLGVRRGGETLASRLAAEIGRISGRKAAGMLTSYERAEHRPAAPRAAIPSA